jgi:hypothetical protein
MNGFVIEPAKRKFQPALIALWGGTGSGKTYSALRLARGMVGPKGRICVIDTENRRALFHAGIGGEWSHIDFQPPFSPERYAEALATVERTGEFDCVIIDSVSHVWEGEGGVLDQADASDKIGLARWKAPKMAYKRLVNTLLRSTMHVIFCLRAKNGVGQNGRGKGAEIVNTGMEPIVEKNFIYEMLVSIWIGQDHRPVHQQHDRLFCRADIQAIKAPDEIIRAIRPGEVITEATGEAIRGWLEGAHRDVLDLARRAASRGTESFRGWWRSVKESDRIEANKIIHELKQVCSQADEEALRQQQEASSSPAPAPDENPFLTAHDEAAPELVSAPPVTAAVDPSIGTIEDYKDRLRRADWIYEMSDVFRNVEAGRKRMRELRQMAERGGPEWQAVFDAAYLSGGLVGKEGGLAFAPAPAPAPNPAPATTNAEPRKAQPAPTTITHDDPFIERPAAAPALVAAPPAAPARRMVTETAPAAQAPRGVARRTAAATASNPF